MLAKQVELILDTSFSDDGHLTLGRVAPEVRSLSLEAPFCWGLLMGFASLCDASFEARFTFMIGAAGSNSEFPGSAVLG